MNACEPVLAREDVRTVKKKNYINRLPERNGNDHYDAGPYARLFPCRCICKRSNRPAAYQRCIVFNQMADAYLRARLYFTDGYFSLSFRQAKIKPKFIRLITYPRALACFPGTYHPEFWMAI